ncbi:hypothetical protein BDK51DRAFT_22230, partial [Blyttiomyces helicus]
VPIILGIGLNYLAHARELKKTPPTHPPLFTKPRNAVQDPFSAIRIPPVAKDAHVDYEAELAVVVGRDCLDATRENALDYVLGYTCANDITSRWWQEAVGQWTFSKSFDTFCPLGPTLVSPALIPNPNALSISLTLNGAQMQDSTTRDMVHDVPALIAFLSQGTTIEAGTVILTGTPPGVGVVRSPPVFLRDGDEVEVTIEKIGTLRNKVEVC